MRRPNAAADAPVAVAAAELLIFEKGYNIIINVLVFGWSAIVKNMPLQAELK